MFLGGAPGGTAGGMKITTFLVLILLARKELLGLPHTNLGKRTIAPDLVQRSLGTAVIFQLTLYLGLFGLCLVTPDGQRFLYLVFEGGIGFSDSGRDGQCDLNLKWSRAGDYHGAHVYRSDRPLDTYGQLEQLQSQKADALQYAKADIIIG